MAISYDIILQGIKIAQNLTVVDGAIRLYLMETFGEKSYGWRLADPSGIVIYSPEEVAWGRQIRKIGKFVLRALPDNQTELRVVQPDDPTLSEIVFYHTGKVLTHSVEIREELQEVARGITEKQYGSCDNVDFKYAQEQVYMQLISATLPKITDLKLNKLTSFVAELENLFLKEGFIKPLGEQALLPRKKVGRPPLTDDEIVHRIAIVMRAEELRKMSNMTQDKIIIELGLYRHDVVRKTLIRNLQKMRCYLIEARDKKDIIALEKAEEITQNMKMSKPSEGKWWVIRAGIKEGY